MRRSQTADPSDELSVMVVRMRQELKAVGRERDAFIAHINAVHERLATDRSKYPSASCAGILKLTLQETVRERDLLRGHVDELHRQLAEQAFEAAAAKVENARRSASPRPPKQLSQHDREEAQKRIRQSIEKSKKANVEQATEEAQRKELAALVAGRKWARKLPGATLEERFKSLHLNSKTWASKRQVALRQEQGLEPKPQLPGAVEPKRVGASELERSMRRLSKPKIVTPKPKIEASGVPAWRPVTLKPSIMPQPQARPRPDSARRASGSPTVQQPARPHEV